MKKETINKIIPATLIILLIILIFNSTYIFGMQDSLSEKIAEAKEMAKPAKLQLVSITASCPDCFDIQEVLTAIKESDVNITDEKTLEAESKVAEKLIEKYSITKLPTIIIGGEIDKTSITGFIKVDDMLIFDGVVPPYIDAMTKKVKGKVAATVINDKRCENCADMTLLLQNVEQSGVIIQRRKEYDASDTKAQELIKNMNVEKLPALILSNDIDVYPIVEKIKQSGVIEQNGYYVIESPVPYVDVKTGNVRGLVDLTMITDETCTECYDVRLHQQILAQMGLAIEDVNTIDINSAEGVQLRIKHKLNKVPTVILTGDMEIYEGFGQVWQQVGTVEDDGAYIFRNIELLGQGIKYKDLQINSVVDGTVQG